MSFSQTAKIYKSELPSIDFREYTLDNGMRVILSKFGNIPMTAVNTTFHAGSKDEKKNKTGLAHLLEHLMFEGSPNIPRGKFDEILNKNGGESNAYTSRDVTSYYISVPSNHLETALWLDSDRISGFGITGKSLKIQKDVVLEEKLLYVDNSPYGSLEEESSKRLFGKSGYSWPVIGYTDDISGFTLDDIREFHEKYYSPSNAVISIVGDIDYDSAIKSVEKYYGDIKSGPDIICNDIRDDEISEEIRADIPDNIHLDGQFIFYRLPEKGTRDYYSLNILNSILSEGESSRFYNEIEYKSELVNEIDTSVIGMEKASLFLVTAIALKGKSLDVIENKIDEIFEDIKSGNISDREFEKVKNRIETLFSSRRQSIVSLADKFSSLKLFYNDPGKINFEILDYIDITKEEVIASANKYLNRNQRLVLNYFPK